MNEALTKLGPSLPYPETAAATNPGSLPITTLNPSTKPKPSSPPSILPIT